MENEIKLNNLKPKWQKRFAFFEEHGTNLFSSQYRNALNKLPFLEKLNIRMNFLAFFFHIFYMLCLGIWRKAIVLLILMIISTIALDIIGNILITDVINKDMLLLKYNRYLGFVWMFFISSLANKAYYLQRVKGSKSWNPFE